MTKEKIENIQQSTDTFSIQYEKNQIDNKGVRFSTMLLAAKYAAMGLLILLTYITGFARYIGDWAIALGGSADNFVIWFGFGFAYSICLSVLVFPIDWYREAVVQVKSGVHGMPWVNTLGRILRRDFFDALLWGGLNYYFLVMYFSLSTTGRQGPMGGNTPQWWIISALWGMLFVPALFIIINLLKLITDNSVKQVPTGPDRRIIKELGRKFRVTVLDVFYYNLGGDFNAETKLVGLFGVYFVFVPAKLKGKDVIIASVAKAMARADVLKGTVINILRWVFFVAGSYLIYLAFNWVYVNNVFSWFSEQAGTGDPAVGIIVMFIIGALYLIATPLINLISKRMDIGADKLASRAIGRPEVYSNYLKMVDTGKAISSETDNMTKMCLMDTYDSEEIERRLATK